MAPAIIELVIGQTVGSYRILSKLSIGGMGTVYRAEHTLIGKPAAVKVLHPELSGSRDIVNRFFNEAKATTTIKHPGIVDVIDFGYMQSGHAFLIMEFLEGMSLARRIKTRGQMNEGEAAMLLRYVCSALQAAHAKGIVHRDLKPDNIFLTPDPESAVGERPKILDFGIAKLTDIGLAGTATKTGAVMGTPTYMSPEQCRGTGQVDHRADLYSIGCIFYELVTGRPPFTDEGAGELIGAHLYVEPDPPSHHNPELSADTVTLIMALLAKNPELRPQTSKELAQRLTVLAQKLGWITAASPAGHTGPTLDDLMPRRPARATPAGSRVSMTPAPADASVSYQATLPSKPPGGTTPYGLTPPPAFTPAASGEPSLSELAAPAEPPEKPTTLSGAASSIIDVPRRSRAGLGIAMAAAAMIAGGAVAFVKLNATGTKTTVPAAVPDRDRTPPLPDPTRAEPTPIAGPADPAPAPPPVVATPAPADEPAVEPEVPPAGDAKVTTRTSDRKLATKRPNKPSRKLDRRKPDRKKPDPPKPPPKKTGGLLIEREL